MTHKYQLVQTAVLEAYDATQATRTETEREIYGTLVKVQPGTGRAPFVINPFGNLTLMEVCDYIAQKMA